MRRRKEDDRRTVLMGITAKGREMVERNRNVGARCITLLFEGFTEEELAQQSRFFERIIGNLEGFSETLLKLAQQNAEIPVPRDPEQKPRVNTKKNYLSY
ncbi:hypothetical protein D3C81_1852300 [compost metagenome]